MNTKKLTPLEKQILVWLFEHEFYEALEALKMFSSFKLDNSKKETILKNVLAYLQEEKQPNDDYVAATLYLLLVQDHNIPIENIAVEAGANVANIVNDFTKGHSNFMIEKTLYPKTTRFGNEASFVQVTEKLDGSNLGLFRLGENLVIAQRNIIFTYNFAAKTFSRGHRIMYRGLKEWVLENANTLENTFVDGSGVFGEWLGMSNIYAARIPQKFAIFAKARIKQDESGEFSVDKINYQRELMQYAFVDQLIPGFMTLVPLVFEAQGDDVPFITQEWLDNKYYNYVTGVAERTGDEVGSYDHENAKNKIEGFVVFDGTNIRKYIRLKNGRIINHSKQGGK